jgi:hypothetical protein
VALASDLFAGCVSTAKLCQIYVAMKNKGKRNVNDATRGLEEESSGKLCVHVFNSSTLAYATLCAFSAIFHPKEL